MAVPSRLNVIIGRSVVMVQTAGVGVGVALGLGVGVAGSRGYYIAARAVPVRRREVLLAPKDSQRRKDGLNAVVRVSPRPVRNMNNCKYQNSLA